MASWLHGIAVACTQYVSTHTSRKFIAQDQIRTIAQLSQRVDLASLATGKYIIVSCCSRWLIFNIHLIIKYLGSGKDSVLLDRFNKEDSLRRNHLRRSTNDYS